MEAATPPVHRAPDLRRHPLTWLSGLAVLAAVALLVGHDVFERSDAASQEKGSGIAATVTRSVAPFHAVELAGSNDVMIHVGPPRGVAVSGDVNLLPRVTTRVRGGRLVIATRGSFDTVAPMSVAVTVPTLDAVTLSGSGRVTISGVDARSFTVDLGGSGAVYASGHAVRVDATLSGSGSLELQQLMARDARGVVSGSGQIWVYASNSVEARVPGTGAVFYGGDPPHVLKSVSGTGAVLTR